MIDMYDSLTGVVVDMEYDIVDNKEVVLDLKIHNVLNNIVGKSQENIDPAIKLAFATNFLYILKENGENKDNV